MLGHRKEILSWMRLMLVLPILPVGNFQLRGLALILKLLALAHISAKLKKRSFPLTLF
jgi:hypothetical protein